MHFSLLPPLIRERANQWQPSGLLGGGSERRHDRWRRWKRGRGGEDRRCRRRRGRRRGRDRGRCRRRGIGHGGRGRCRRRGIGHGGRGRWGSRFAGDQDGRRLPGPPSGKRHRYGCRGIHSWQATNLLEREPGRRWGSLRRGCCWGRANGRFGVRNQGGRRLGLGRCVPLGGMRGACASARHAGDASDAHEAGGEVQSPEFHPAPPHIDDRQGGAVTGASCGFSRVTTRWHS